jgi:hypothetical protein
VTMVEPGVSRLVSVDLGGAERLLAQQANPAQSAVPGPPAPPHHLHYRARNSQG